jgi:hypothetical protein
VRERIGLCSREINVVGQAHNIRCCSLREHLALAVSCRRCLMG